MKKSRSGDEEIIKSGSGEISTEEESIKTIKEENPIGALVVMKETISTRAGLILHGTKGHVLDTNAFGVRIEWETGQITELPADKICWNVLDTIFSLPVTWSVSGTLQVKGRTLEEAMQNFNEQTSELPLPVEYTYIEDSFQLWSNDPDELRDLVNVVGYSGRG